MDEGIPAGLIRSTSKDLRKFGWTMGIIFGLIAGFFYWKNGAVWPALAGVSVFFLIVGTLTPIILKPIQWAWMGMALVMGAVMSRVILTILFIVVFIPIGFVTRMMGIDFMGMKKIAGKTSFWTERTPDPSGPSRYERQA